MRSITRGRDTQKSGKDVDPDKHGLYVTGEIFHLSKEPKVDYAGKMHVVDAS
jgi:hypothetical protein